MSARTIAAAELGVERVAMCAGLDGHLVHLVAVARHLGEQLGELAMRRGVRHQRIRLAGVGGGVREHVGAEAAHVTGTHPRDLRHKREAES